MDAVSAAASVTGILGFTGQAISGILKLRSLFQGCASASKSISKWLNDLNLLIQTLEDVKDMISNLQDLPEFDSEALLASLQIQIEDCSRDVHSWVSKAGKAHPDFSSVTKRTFKRLLVAINKEDNVEAYLMLGRHRENISTKLSLIGRSLDIQHALGLKDLSNKVDQANVTSEETGKVTLGALQGLQTALQADLSGHGESMRGSLASFSGSLVRIESLFGSIAGTASFSGSRSASRSMASMQSSRGNRRFSKQHKGKRPAKKQTKGVMKSSSESKAEIFEAKVAAAVGEANTSDSSSEQSFVYHSQPVSLRSRSRGLRRDYAAGRKSVFNEESLIDEESTVSNHSTSKKPVKSVARKRDRWGVDAPEDFMTKWQQHQRLLPPHKIATSNIGGVRTEPRSLSNLESIKTRIASLFGFGYRTGNTEPRTWTNDLAGSLEHFGTVPETGRAPVTVTSTVDRLRLPMIFLDSGSIPKVVRIRKNKLHVTGPLPRQKESLLTVSVRVEAKRFGMMTGLLTTEGVETSFGYTKFAVPIEWRRRTGPDMARLNAAVVLARHETSLADIDLTDLVMYPLLDNTVDIPFGIDREEMRDNNAMNMYLELVCEEGVRRCRSLMQDQIAWCLEGHSPEWHGNLEDENVPISSNYQYRIEAARQKCWYQGYNLDEIDRLLHQCFPHLSSAMQKVTTIDEDAGLNNSTAGTNVPRDWTNKQDRINLWLLQNLQSSDEQMNVHKKELSRSGADVGGDGVEEWARTVLKYWFLDEAAVGRSGVASTNGAVDSEGLKHDVRVDLGIEEEDYVKDEEIPL